MDLNYYINKTSRLVTLEKLLLIVTILMTITTIYSIRKIYTIEEKKMITIVPMSASGPMKVGYNTVSDEYLIWMAHEIVNLAFTYSSSNARKQFERLLTLYAPEAREANRRVLLNSADKIEKVKRVRRSFYTDNIEITTKNIYVTGETIRQLGGRLERESVKIDIQYRVNYGRFMIEHINRVDASTGERKKPKVTEVTKTNDLDKGDSTIIEGIEDGIR